MTTTGQPFGVVLPDPTGGGPTTPNLVATIWNADICLPPFNQAPAPLGNASGTFTISNALIITGSSEYHGGTLTGSYSVQRVGTTVVFTTFPIQVATSNGTVIATMTSLGAGTGQFVTLTPLGSCTLPVMNASGSLVGLALQPA